MKKYDISGTIKATRKRKGFGVRRIWMSALIALSVLILLIAGACAEGNMEIEGIEDGDVLSADQYLSVKVYVDGEIVECEWLFSPDNVARFSSGKKVRLYDLTTAAEVAITAVHPESGTQKTVTVLVVPRAEKINIVHGENTVTGEKVMIDRADGAQGVQLSAVTRPQGANEAIEWASSDEAIATVDAYGYVSFHANGECTISAETVDGLTAQTTLLISYAAKTIDVMAPEEMAVGETVSLYAAITPDEAAQDGVVWSSSKEKVISVSENGEITARREGKAVITATANSGISKEVEIEAYYPVETVQIRNTFSLKVGQTEQIIVRVLPQEAKYKNLTFVSLNPEIATVDKDGNVTGVSPGTVTIIASASNGVSAHLTLEVKKVKLESIALTDHFVTLRAGESAAIEPIFTPKYSSEKALTYTSTDPSVADVDASGVVYAFSEGRCDIHIQSEREDIKPLVFRVNVQKEGALPLQGIIVGINPGCQEIKNGKRLPVSPFSAEQDNAVVSSKRGVETKTPEYKLTLDIALWLKEELEKLGAQVVMTRTASDVDIDNIERAKMLNDAGVDISLQIHMSASDDRRTEGFTVRAKYSDYESQMIGEAVLENACRVSGALMRKMNKSNSYMSLNWSETPALILECGFLTNVGEDVKLNSPVYQQLLAQGIAEGLYEYFTGMPAQ